MVGIYAVQCDILIGAYIMELLGFVFVCCFVCLFHDLPNITTLGVVLSFFFFPF
jgi:hypothetical protein